jgi:4-amino-4-deoxy-L-arabinose transferase-like glycosyltransferase
MVRLVVQYGPYDRSVIMLSLDKCSTVHVDRTMRSVIHFLLLKPWTDHTILGLVWSAFSRVHRTRYNFSRLQLSMGRTNWAMVWSVVQVPHYTIQLATMLWLGFFSSPQLTVLYGPTDHTIRSSHFSLTLLLLTWFLHASFSMQSGPPDDIFSPWNLVLFSPRATPAR